jgi:hypothetical protein
MTRHCHETDEDRQFLAGFQTDVDMLTGMIDEMFVRTPVVLLSPGNAAACDRKGETGGEEASDATQPSCG